ncbi:NAD(P)H-dependent oxidoreductase subunit E [Saccharothrix sp.]|uniref:NAD(P)H-dependent oxidoreductase subunit E n=1 Tax=Saccharothrix sp. TaxID=1873460 RepID=UPI0028116308|nr:NAD(P)H-dependent oxidoreductase subunit E [Saccharothrix sp.]
MDVADRVLAVIEAHRHDRGALLPILHGLQAEFGYIDQSVIPLLAKELNLSRADVHGVVTFYRDFRSEPPGRVTVLLCRAEACQAVGAEELVAHAERTIAKIGQTAGNVTLDQVFCLGNCALGPAAQINGRLHGRLTPHELDAAIADQTREESS